MELANDVSLGKVIVQFNMDDWDIASYSAPVDSTMRMPHDSFIINSYLSTLEMQDQTFEEDMKKVDYWLTELRSLGINSKSY